MLLLILGLASANDYLPDWDARTPDEDAPSISDTVGAERSRQAPRVASRAVPLAETRQPDHVWVDTARLSLAISGEWGRRYTVLCTATAGDAVAHWQQGPYDAPDQTEVISVVVPVEVTLSEMDAVVSCRLVSARFDGSSVRYEGLPALELDGTTAQGRPHVRAAELSTDEVW